MQHVDDQGRPEPPVNADEIGTLVGFLEFQRATLKWKTQGLGAEGLAVRTARSAMSLGGILKHMAWVEDHWFSYCLHGRERASMWLTTEASSIRDWEWTSAAADLPDELMGIWRGAVAGSRVAMREALDRGGLDQIAIRASNDGTAPSLRWIIVHMIEEYARHNGHADLLRESVDGQVGE